MPDLLTRKDFVKAANALKSGREASLTLAPAENAPRIHRVHNSIAEAMANALARTNGKFDRVRFLDECGWCRI